MASQAVLSELPGKVFEIEVEEGQSVSEDDPLIILESMKMEIPVVSPADGVVKKIMVAIDDMVVEGQEVVIIET